MLKGGVRFDLPTIIAEIGSSPPTSPLPLPVAIAAVNDVFRDAGRAPIADSRWAAWYQKLPTPLFRDQVSMLGHFLLVSDALRTASVTALTDTSHVLEDDFFDLLEHIEPLTAAMIANNAFRQEEFLRRWVSFCQGRVEGETVPKSRARLKKLDYKAALAEVEKAEAARKKEEERRAKLRAEAERRRKEAEARSWRE